MKRFLLFTALLLVVVPSFADDNVPEPTQKPDAPYRLFRTQNIYTFLKLDTRTGQVWQLQWGEKDYRWSVPINREILLEHRSPAATTRPVPGRFTLCPTANIFTFLLLDQEDGRAWQTQWGKDDSERFIKPVP